LHSLLLLFSNSTNNYFASSFIISLLYIISNNILFFCSFCTNIFSNHIKEQIKNRSGNTFYCSFCFDLVMEQSDSCKRHRHIIFVTCADYIVVTNGSSRLRNIFHTAFVSTFDIISKREERI